MPSPAGGPQGNHIYTSGSIGTNAAVIKGALRANCPDKLTVILPQSLRKQPAESQDLLKQVRVGGGLLLCCGGVGPGVGRTCSVEASEGRSTLGRLRVQAGRLGVCKAGRGHRVGGTRSSMRGGGWLKGGQRPSQGGR